MIDRALNDLQFASRRSPRDPVSPLEVLNAAMRLVTVSSDAACASGAVGSDLQANVGSIVSTVAQISSLLDENLAVICAYDPNDPAPPDPSDYVGVAVALWRRSSEVSEAVRRLVIDDDAAADASFRVAARGLVAAAGSLAATGCPCVDLEACIVAETVRLQSAAGESK